MGKGKPYVTVRNPWEFLAVQWLGLVLSLQAAWVQSLVRQVSYCKIGVQPKDVLSGKLAFVTGL